MIETHRVDAVEARQIVLVRRVVAVPRHHVERRVIDLRDPQLAEEFGDDAAVRSTIFERRHRREEVARIGQPVGADRAEFRQTERRAVVFADVAARRAVGQIDAELDAARNHADLARARPPACRAPWRSARAPVAERSAIRHRRCRR